MSGPLLDRIDLQVEVPRLAPAELRMGQVPNEASESVRTRVIAARGRMLERAGTPNARLDQAQTREACRLEAADESLLERAMDSLQLSARALHRILRVARTIADLDASAAIRTPHLSEALGYRRFERALGAG
jgi:magnesium chelatase family protein